MNKIWAIEAAVIVVILGIEPTADAINITKLAKVQYESWIGEKISNYGLAKTILSIQTKKTTIKEIEETENKTLLVNTTIGTNQVMYWRHKVKDMFFVKNDSMNMHYNKYTKDVVYFRKQWTNIDINTSSFDMYFFEPQNYYWKEAVIFPDEDDLGSFYQFTINQNYPVICWEVRHKDGSTLLYNQTGHIIGNGVASPSYTSFTLSGYDNSSPGDEWRLWRENANKWFIKWFSQPISISHPTNQQVSNYVSNPDIKYFYEIAHSGGLPTRFQTNADNVYYTADQLKEDMKNRDSINLAILCSCEAMQDTGPETLSYEFRKGETQDTVTIGYVGMGRCPGWSNSLDWQDAMFTYIDRGHTFKQAFNLACSIYPEIADCVVFVGDEKARIDDLAPVQEYPSKQLIQTIRVVDLIKFFINSIFSFYI